MQALRTAGCLVLLNTNVSEVPVEERLKSLVRRKFGDAVAILKTSTLFSPSPPQHQNKLDTSTTLFPNSPTNHPPEQPHALHPMAQGTLKNIGRKPTAKVAHSKRQISKVAKVKNNKLGVDKQHRKFTAGMAAKTEALLSERVGHLEILGGKGKKTKKVAKSGGSKKFG
ncbi:hypothetical protein G7046_g4592 [Stylonectria norvegica]|nr:hypothetical protein G7046_g4592 [Stylonectria norvegica]